MVSILGYTEIDPFKFIIIGAGKSGKLSTYILCHGSHWFSATWLELNTSAINHLAVFICSVLVENSAAHCRVVEVLLTKGPWMGNAQSLSQPEAPPRAIPRSTSFEGTIVPPRPIPHPRPKSDQYITVLPEVDEKIPSAANFGPLEEQEWYWGNISRWVWSMMGFVVVQ